MTPFSIVLHFAFFFCVPLNPFVLSGAQETQIFNSSSSCSLSCLSHGGFRPDFEIYIKVDVKDVLYLTKNLKHVTLKLLNETTGKVEEMKLTLGEESLKEFNITLDQIDNQLVKKHSDGTATVSLPGGRSLPILVESMEVINFINKEAQTSFAVSKHGLLTRSLKDMKDEPSMQVAPLSPLSWPQPSTACDGIDRNLLVSITPQNLSIYFHNQTTTKEAKFDQHSSSLGLLLMAFNLWSCQETFSQVFRTYDFGYFRDMIWTLDHVHPGHLVILASLGTASLNLGEGRKGLSSRGLMWVDFFLHRDGWLAAGISGAKIMAEILVPNLREFDSSGAPFLAEISLPRPDSLEINSCYVQWPLTPQWNARRTFCNSKDGYGMLCDCLKPFQIPSRHDANDTSSTTENLQIPLLIAGGNRTRHLYRLMESLGNQNGVTKESFLFFTDSDCEETRQLAFILGLKVLFHSSKGMHDPVGRIGVNLQFGLFHSLAIFPEAKYFIVLEEDLLLAPDFYAYMRHYAPIFDMDPSIFCISAFNHLSYPHTSRDPSQMYRVQTYPAYGWMMPRENVEYVVPKFLPDKMKQDWDYFMGSPIINQNRETLIPDINRSYHWATGGIHMKISLLAEEFYLSRNLNKETNVLYSPLKSLLKKNYEGEFFRLIRRAKSVIVNEEITNFTTPIQKGEIYRIFVRKVNESDDYGFRLIGEMLQIWTLDARDHHNHAWRLYYMDATLFVIGVPLSPYRKNESLGMPDSSFPTMTVENQHSPSFGDNRCRSSGSTGSGKTRWRLLVVSSRARHLNQITNSILPEVVLVLYTYETFTLDHILAHISDVLQGRKVESVAFVLSGSEAELNICGPGDKALSTHSASEVVSIREFFKTLVMNHLDKSLMNARLDFLAAHPANGQNGPIISSTIQNLLEIPVGLSVDLVGNDVEVVRWLSEGSTKVSPGMLYLDIKKLKENLRCIAMGTRNKRKDLKKEYEKIRTVGKGAFGTAILYRRKEDDVMVIIKEINMLELSASERQMALNEVNVLAAMDHPNIISYLDSFEKDSFLCIEMEYADGGNLAQFLTSRTKRLSEKEILMIFHQICSSIRYMQEQNVLHRDLKTANIFLTKQGAVKVGDFGISKMMTTKHARANTVLGTPYYISPEMCEGKEYDEKSDIWALGCILYEMACLQKTFEGSNLPALVNKIMKGQFAPIKGNYSPGFRQLVRDLLQRDPEFRPTASEIVQDRLPELLSQFDFNPIGVDEIDTELMMSIEVGKHTTHGRATKPQRSVVYHLKVYDSSISLTPVPLPPRTRVKEMAVSNTHIIVLSSECLVYTWGEGRKGQLGHETLEPWRSRPGVVEALKEKGITRVVAGDGFSIFASDNGIVMTCGDGTFGCLGHGDWNSSSKPKLIEQLLSVDVSGIACGSHHVVVVGGEGDVYAWGKGEGGRLGLGHEEDCCIPTMVEVDDNVLITNVKCGGDGTIFLTDQGAMLACGRNTRNKLGLSDAGGLFSTKKDVDKATVPTRIKCVGCRAVDVAMGPTHTAVLTETGQVLTFGRNCEAQLGRGNCRSTSQPVLARSMSNKVVTMIQCGATFTVAGTIENALYLWGTRAVSLSSRPTTQEGFTNTWWQEGSTSSKNEKDPEFNFSEENLKSSQSQKNQEERDGSASSAADKKSQRDINMRDVLHQPQEILALYASREQITKGETVSLSCIHCQNQSIFLVVDTTVPLPRPGRQGSISKEERDNDKLKKSKHLQQGRNNKSTEISEKEGSNDEMDTLGPVPDWLKAELKEAVISSMDNGDRIFDPQIRCDSLPKEMERKMLERAVSVSSRTTTQSAKVEGRRIGRPPYSKSRNNRNKDAPPFVASSQKVRRNKESIRQQVETKEKKMRRESEDAAKAKEDELNNEIERLRLELERQQSLQEETKQKPQTPESTMCLLM